jgi:hypothetical protein
MMQNNFGKASVPARVAGLVAFLAALVAATAAGQSTPVSPAGIPPGDPVRGQALYQGCESCHSINENDVGPRQSRRRRPPRRQRQGLRVFRGAEELRIDVGRSQPETDG